MQLAVILPSYIDTEERLRLTKLCFPTLLRTKMERLEKSPLIMIMARVGNHPFEYPTENRWAQAGWRGMLMGDPVGVKGVEQALAFGTTFLFMHCEADYVTWLGNDTLANPYWLEELQALIQRHPGGKAWSVYRSAHEATHRLIGEDGTDVQVVSIGYGMTVERNDWLNWGFDWRDQRNFSNLPHSTMDLRHSREVVGERWVTKKSYLEHTGRTGEHCRPDVPEWATDFQGFDVDLEDTG